MENNNHNNNKHVPAAPSIDQEILRRKVVDFEKALVELQAKFGVVVVPIVNVTMHGIMPDLVYMAKEEFDKKMEAGKEAMGVKKAD